MFVEFLLFTLPPWIPCPFEADYAAGLIWVGFLRPPPIPEPIPPPIPDPIPLPIPDPIPIEPRFFWTIMDFDAAF